jgi:hypothetical protein
MQSIRKVEIDLHQGIKIELVKQLHLRSGRDSGMRPMSMKRLDRKQANLTRCMGHTRIGLAVQHWAHTPAAAIGGRVSYKVPTHPPYLLH